jgi:histidine triad (HIT) family protein
LDFKHIANIAQSVEHLHGKEKVTSSILVVGSTLWVKKYFQQKYMEDCIFCKIIKGEISACIIDQNEFVIVFVSLENHPLIVTKKHVRDIYDLSEQDGIEVMNSAVKIAKATKSALNCDGIQIVQSNGVAAGQEVFHYHMHVKPKWVDDASKPLLSNQEIANLIKSKL